MAWLWAPSPRRDHSGRHSVVHEAVVGVVGQRIDVRDRLPVEDHPDKFGRSPPGVASFQGVRVPTLSAVHHESLHLVSDIRRHFGGDGAGAAHRFPGLHQGGGLGTLRRGDQVQRAQLVLLAPTTPVVLVAIPRQHLGFGGYSCESHGSLHSMPPTHAGEDAAILHQGPHRERRFSPAWSSLRPCAGQPGRTRTRARANRLTRRNVIPNERQSRDRCPSHSNGIRYTEPARGQPAA